MCRLQKLILKRSKDYYRDEAQDVKHQVQTSRKLQYRIFVRLIFKVFLTRWFVSFSALHAQAAFFHEFIGEHQKALKYYQRAYLRLVDAKKSRENYDESKILAEYMMYKVQAPRRTVCVNANASV